MKRKILIISLSLNILFAGYLCWRIGRLSPIWREMGDIAGKSWSASLRNDCRLRYVGLRPYVVYSGDGNSPVDFWFRTWGGDSPLTVGCIKNPKEVGRELDDARQFVVRGRGFYASWVRDAAFTVSQVRVQYDDSPLCFDRNGTGDFENGPDL